MRPLDPAAVLQQIASLKLSYPDIWDDGDEQLLADCLEAQTDTNEFLRVLVDRLHEAEAMEFGIATRIATLEERQVRYELKQKAMRTLAFRVMEAAELRKVQLPEATLSITNGQRRVIITDEQALPDIACRFKREPDKTKIKELLATGIVAGAELSNAEPHITIRSR